MSGSNARTLLGRIWTVTQAALYCVLGVLIASQVAAGAVTVSDSTFADANWNLTQFAGGAGGSVSAGQLPSGDNPGAFRNLTDTLSGGGAGIVLGTNIYTPFTYNPVVSGAIASFNYAEDAACTSGWFGQGQSTGPAILQSGNLYILSTSSVITGPAAAWAPHALSGLTALDFGLVNVTATTIFDNAQHPDFSASGAPLQVGYFRENGTGLGLGGYTLAAGIDNWQITIVGAVPVLQSAVSRKLHGAAGTFDLPLAMVATNPTTEPRQSSTATIVMTFDVPVVSADAAITEGTATAGALTFSGNDVIVPLTGVADQQYVTVSLTNISSAVLSGGIASIRLGLLRGDVNQTRVVSVADLGLVNAQLSQLVTAANYLKDVNASGAISVADKGITNANLTRALPAP
jgi:hypothetical protein